MRATLAATVTMSGEVLPPLLIFKGKRNGRIEQKELPNLPPVCPYAVQKKAWMDVSMMNLCIEQCLSPWKDMLPPQTVPLLILDSFRVHMMGSTVTKFNRWELKYNTFLVAAYTCASLLILASISQLKT